MLQRMVGQLTFFMNHEVFLFHIVACFCNIMFSASVTEGNPYPPSRLWGQATFKVSHFLGRLQPDFEIPRGYMLTLLGWAAGGWSSMLEIWSP